MQVVLTVLMCSVLHLQCMAPHTFPERFKDFYSCMVAGYEKSLAKTIELGKHEVNSEMYFIKFRCTEVPEEEETT